MTASARHRRSVITSATSVLLALSSYGLAAETQAAPGIVNGPSLRLAGSHAFTFSPSSSGGSIGWSVDRETVSDTGIHTRTNGILSGTGSNKTFSLPAVSGSETIYYVSAADAGVSDVDTVQVFPANTKTWFTYRSAGNPDVRVYTVIPSSLSTATNVVMAMHGKSRTASSYADYWRTWTTQHDYIVLCPYYDLVNWPTTGNYQMGNVFSSDDCEGVKNPEARWTFTIDEGIHELVRSGFVLNEPRFDLWGFSGGGQHVHRFMLFKPNAKVRIAIAAGSGWYTAPDLNIDCPYGPADPSLSFNHQDLLQWTNKDMVIMVGTADTVRDADLRITAQADAQGLNRFVRAGYMYAKGKAVNPASHWQLINVPGIGHQAQEMAEAAQSVLFGTTVDVSTSAAPEVRTMGRFLRIGPNPTSASTMLSGQGWTSGDDVVIGVYDLAGRRVAAGTTRATNGVWQLAWSTIARPGSIAKGVYFVRARDREGQAGQKIFVLE